MAAVRARMRWAMRAVTPVGGVPAVALESELVLESVEGGLDPLVQRAQEAGAGALGLVACGWAQQGQLGLVQVVLQVPGAVALVGNDRVGTRRSSMLRRTSRSSWLELVTAQATGRPAEVAIRRRRRPQKKRDPSVARWAGSGRTR
jgi:hypothetical protein